MPSQPAQVAKAEADSFGSDEEESEAAAETGAR